MATRCIRKVRADDERSNAAVRGAHKAGADEIVVIDCHGAGGAGSFNSILLNQADPHAEYVLGAKWMRYTAPLEKGCDAALLVGADAMAGTPDGVLCHTVSSEAWYNAWINQDLVGESGICAAVCGTWDCPVAMVSGDVATCNEVQKLLGTEVAAAPTKIGIYRFAAQHLSPQVSCDLIEEKAFESLQNLALLKPYKPTTPTTFKVMLATPDRALDFEASRASKLQMETVRLFHGQRLLASWDQFWFHQ